MLFGSHSTQITKHQTGDAHLLYLLLCNRQPNKNDALANCSNATSNSNASPVQQRHRRSLTHTTYLNSNIQSILNNDTNPQSSSNSPTTIFTIIIIILCLCHCPYHCLVQMKTTVAHDLSQLSFLSQEAGTDPLLDSKPSMFQQFIQDKDKGRSGQLNYRSQQLLFFKFALEHQYTKSKCCLWKVLLIVGRENID